MFGIHRKYPRYCFNVYGWSDQTLVVPGNVLRARYIGQIFIFTIGKELARVATCISCRR